MMRAIISTGIVGIGGTFNSSNYTTVDLRVVQSLEFFVRAVDNTTEIFLKGTSRWK